MPKDDLTKSIEKLISATQNSIETVIEEGIKKGDSNFEISQILINNIISLYAKNNYFVSSSIKKRISDAYEKFFNEYKFGNEIISEIKKKQGLEFIAERRKKVDFGKKSINKRLKIAINDEFQKGSNIQEIKKAVSKTIGKDYKKSITGLVQDRVRLQERGVNVFVANQFNLKHFIYAGTKRDNTRCHCLKYVNKALTVEEADRWKPTIDPEECAPIWNEEKDGKYDWRKHMGGYACYHTPKFISENLYKKLK